MKQAIQNTIDLFNCTIPKKEILLQFILSRNWTRTSEVDRWGLDHFHIRARRDAQEMCADGLFRRMTEDEKAFYLGSTKEDAWVRNDFR